MARRKQKVADKPAEQPTNGAAPLTLDDVSKAIDNEAKRLAKAETTLALKPGDLEAETVRRESLAKLATLDADRSSLKRIEQRRKAALESKAEQARKAAAQKDAQTIPAGIRDNGKDFAAAVEHFNGFVSCIERIEQRTAGLTMTARSLPGDDRVCTMLARAIRTVAISRPLRPILQRLTRTHLVDTWIEVVRVPAEPSRQPMQGESHAQAQGRVAALPTTAADIYGETAANVDRLLAELLGPAPDPSAGAPWHGRLDGEPTHDSFNELMKAGKLNVDDSARKERQNRRVKDSARPVVRGKDGAVITLAGEPAVVYPDGKDLAK